MEAITTVLLVVFLLSAGDRKVTTFTVPASNTKECLTFAADIKKLIENRVNVADYGFACVSSTLKSKGDKP